MAIPVEQIIAAVDALGASGLRERLEAVCGGQSAEAHRIFPEIWPHIREIMTVVDGAQQIARALRAAGVPSEALASPPARVEEGITLPEGCTLETALFGERGVLEGVSLRVESAFGLVGLRTIGELALHNRGVLHMRGFGRTSFAQVKEGLRARGFNPDEFWCLRNPGDPCR